MANLDFPVVLDFYGPIESEILNLTYKKAFPTEQILKPMWTDYLIRWFLAKKKLRW